MNKVLIYSEAWGCGGIEAFIMNVLRGAQESDIKFDIYTTWDWNDSYDDELKKMGVHRFTTFKGEKPDQITRLKKGVAGFTEKLKTQHYDAVWVNTMNGAGFLYAVAAKKAGIPMRIMHAHSADVGSGATSIKRVISNAGSLFFGGYSTKNLACSQASGKFLYRGRPFKVVKNGIDTEKFIFNDKIRKKTREELGVGDSVLLGNVGRISPEKNPLFQVRVFFEYKKINNNAKYIMVGKPDMAEEVIALANQFNIGKDIIIHDAVDNVAPYYCAMDAMLMPSVAEGLGIVQIEAQCASLPVLSSDVLPIESRITDLAQPCSLEDSPGLWALRLNELVGLYWENRSNAYAKIVANCGYSYKSASSSMVRILKGEE